MWNCFFLLFFSFGSLAPFTWPLRILEIQLERGLQSLWCVFCITIMQNSSLGPCWTLLFCENFGPPSLGIGRGGLYWLSFHFCLKRSSFYIRFADCINNPKHLCMTHNSCNQKSGRKTLMGPEIPNFHPTQFNSGARVYKIRNAMGRARNDEQLNIFLRKM